MTCNCTRAQNFSCGPSIHIFLQTNQHQQETFKRKASNKGLECKEDGKLKKKNNNIYFIPSANQTQNLLRRTTCSPKHMRKGLKIVMSGSPLMKDKRVQGEQNKL